jgi:hypothetical protein
VASTPARGRERMIRRFDIDTSPIYPAEEHIIIPNLMEGRYANYKETLAKGAADAEEKIAEWLEWNHGDLPLATLIRNGEHNTKGEG